MSATPHKKRCTRVELENPHQTARFEALDKQAKKHTKARTLLQQPTAKSQTKVTEHFSCALAAMG